VTGLTALLNHRRCEPPSWTTGARAAPPSTRDRNQPTRRCQVAVVS